VPADPWALLAGDYEVAAGESRFARLIREHAPRWHSFAPVGPIPTDEEMRIERASGARSEGGGPGGGADDFDASWGKITRTVVAKRDAALERAEFVQLREPLHPRRGWHSKRRRQREKSRDERRRLPRAMRRWLEQTDRVLREVLRRNEEMFDQAFYQAALTGTAGLKVSEDVQTLTFEKLQENRRWLEREIGPAFVPPPARTDYLAGLMMPDPDKLFAAFATSPGMSTEGPSAATVRALEDNVFGCHQRPRPV
jgi:hypothetical protein